MARLPDSTVLGAAPSAASGRQISSIDGSAYGQGLQALAQGMRSLAAGQAAQAEGYSRMGRGIAAGFEQIGQAIGGDDDLKDAQRRSDFLVEKIKLDGERDRETDPTKLEGYGQRYQELAQRYASQYADPRRKQKFLISAADDVAKATERTTNLALGYQRDAMKGQALERLENLRKAGLAATDPEERRKITDQGALEFQTLREKGVLTPAEEVNARQKWVKGFVTDSLKLMPPEQRIAALEGSRGSLKVRESGGDPTKENEFGFAGLYQFGAPRLQTLGVYQPGPNEDLKGWNQTGKTAPGKWSGQFNIPGFPNVKTKADFLANPAAQEAVYELDDQRKSQEIRSNGLDKYIGQTVGGVKITEEGIKNMIHLGGLGGTQAFFTSGGVIDRADKNGTKLSDYARMGLAGKGSGVASVLDPLEQKDIKDGAAYELMQKSRIADQEQRQAAAQQQAERAQRVNSVEVGILDGTAGREDFIRLRQNGDVTEASDIKRFEGLLAAQDKKRQDELTWQQVWGGQRVLNPYSKEDRGIAEAGVDTLVNGSGGKISKPEAALRVYERTGVLPESGVVAMRGTLAKNDVDSVKAVGTIAANMMFAPTARFPGGNQRVFDGVQNGKELEDVGTAFNYLVNKVGLPVDDAAKRIVEMNSPEYKKTFKVDDKEADTFEKNLAKNAISEMENGKFSGSGWFFDNRFTNNAMRNDIATTFATEASYFYKKHGDPELAKAQAMEQMKKIYGVSNGTLMKFPPENVYPPIKGSTDYIYRQAAEDIFKATGNKVDPKNITLQEIPVLTAEGFRAKSQSTRYQIMYRTKNEQGYMIDHVLPTGTRWSPDVAGEAAKATQEANTKAQSAWETERAQRAPSPVVTPDQIGSRSMAPGRPERSQEERQRLADEATAFRRQRMEDVKQAAPSNAERQRKRDEALAGNKDESLLGNWLRSTPANPLKGFVPDRSNRNRLPGGNN